MDQPNLLIITTDQHNPSCFGYAGHTVVRTPNIDALAAGGVNFARTYVSHPLCQPSRATLFTGLNPRGHRVRMNGIPLGWDVPTFTEELRNAGYSTHCVGKVHLRPSNVPNGMPLDEVDPAESPEARALWLNGRIKELPSPYYGFETVDYVGGHSTGSTGHYLDWLEREHPDEARLFHEKTPLAPPSPAFALYNRTSFKWALPEEFHPLAYIADRSIEYLNEMGRLRRERDGAQAPFLLWSSIQDPHSPFAPPAEWAYRYDPEDVPPPLTDEGELDRMPPHYRDLHEKPITTSGSLGQAMRDTDPYRAECAAHYYAVIELVDKQVGRILDALSDNGLEDDTVVLFTADHGEALGDHYMWGKGPYHYDSVIRVPFIVRWPNVIAPGVKHESPVSLLDFAPTVLDIAGLPVPEGPVPLVREAPANPPAWPGSSLMPVLKGERDLTDSHALVEEDEDYLGFRMRTLVTDHYRLTVYSGQPYGELFDFHEDPNEFHNLWDDPGRRALREELRLELLDRLLDSDYPLPRQLSRS